MVELKRVYCNNIFDSFYLNYCFETGQYIITNFSKKFILGFVNYLIYLNYKPIGFVIGKHLIIENKNLFIVNQLYLLPDYRYYIKKVLDTIVNKFGNVVTIVKESTKISKLLAKYSERI
jgi:hypothetical protein